MDRGIFILAIAALILASIACGVSSNSTNEQSASSPTQAGGNLDQGAGDIERPEPPAEYAGLNNPLAEDADAEETGKGIYNVNCASCHGELGMGDGPASQYLDPQPKALAKDGVLSDGYLFWRISEGGAIASFKSAMPAWKSSLSEQQIWQVITYLRTLMQ
jgi:mono/diheme cytochrome c family protein